MIDVRIAAQDGLQHVVDGDIQARVRERGSKRPQGPRREQDVTERARAQDEDAARRSVVHRSPACTAASASSTDSGASAAMHVCGAAAPPQRAQPAAARRTR